jgi:hypothetical protein
MRFCTNLEVSNQLLRRSTYLHQIHTTSARNDYHLPSNIILDHLS